MLLFWVFVLHVQPTVLAETGKSSPVALISVLPELTRSFQLLDVSTSGCLVLGGIVLDFFRPHLVFLFNYSKQF